VERSPLAPSNRARCNQVVADYIQEVADHRAAVLGAEVYPVRLLALPHLRPIRTSGRTARPLPLHSSNKKPLSSPS